MHEVWKYVISKHWKHKMLYTISFQTYKMITEQLEWLLKAEIKPEMLTCDEEESVLKKVAQRRLQ